VGDQELPNSLSLTHAAVARGPIWLCAFGPAVLHTPALQDSAKHACKAGFSKFTSKVNLTPSISFSNQHIFYKPLSILSDKAKPYLEASAVISYCYMETTDKFV